MTQELQFQYSNTTNRRSLAAAAELTDEEIKERRLKHIAEITKDLAPPQSEDLTYEQEEWLNFRMARPFPKPYRPFPPIKIPYKWIETEDIKT